MRVMVIVKATAKSEVETGPADGAEALFVEMGRFNEELVGAGVMLSGEGLHPSSKGKRVSFATGKPIVTDGPFAETKELVAGFWIWKVASMDEAVAWASRIPTGGDEMEVELRRVYEAEDFGPELTPEVRAQEERLREELARRANAGG